MRTPAWTLALALLLPLQTARAEAGDEPAPNAGTESSEEGDPTDPFSRVGGYVGVAGIRAFESFENDFRKADDSWGANARAGYRFHPHFGAELQFEWYDEFDFHGSLDGSNVDGYLTTVNGKAWLVKGRLQPYLIGGLGWLEIDGGGRALGGSQDDFAVKVGGGFDLYATEHWALNLEATYVVPSGDVNDFEIVSVGAGILFRF
jgi:opacity protein-like surface antigen